MKNYLLIFIVVLLSCQQVTVVTTADSNLSAANIQKQGIHHFYDDDLSSDAHSSKPANIQAALPSSQTYKFGSASICKATLY